MISENRMTRPSPGINYDQALSEARSYLLQIPIANNSNPNALSWGLAMCFTGLHSGLMRVLCKREMTTVVLKVPSRGTEMSAA